MTPFEQMTFLNITAALTDAGFDLTGLEMTKIAQDRLWLAPNQGFKESIDSAKANGAFLNDFWLSTSPAHGGYKDWGVRQNVGSAPLQITGSSNGFEVDLDYYNGVRDLAGIMGHIFIEGLPNTLHITKTNPYSAAAKLRKRGVNLGHDCR